MSLATRCTSCGTVFRVVQDQLKVSEGWVRCGRCDEVFNAIEGLFDLERDAPPNWKPPVAPPTPPAATVTATFTSQPEPPEDDDDVFQLSDGDRIHSRFFQPEQADVSLKPAQTVSERDRIDFADARFNTELLQDGDPSEAPAKRTGGTGIKRSSVKQARAKQEAARRGPDFVQQAQKRERWRRPGMRILLSVLALLLTSSLTAQAAFHFRNLLSAQSPALRPWLATGCEWLHCQIEPPHRIDDVAVESSTLSPAPGGNGYRLSVVLRNRGPLALAMPWVDLSLTDPSGQLVVRRALAPVDFGMNPAVIAANSETPLQVLLSAGGRPISGYTVEIFYP